MALPLEATPSLDEQGMEKLYKMMDEWEQNKTPIHHIVIDDDVVQRGILATEGRRKKRLENAND